MAASLQEREIELIAQRVHQQLLQSGSCKAKIGIPQLLETIAQIIRSNMEEEMTINAQAEKLMQQYEGQIQNGEVDSHKMFHMIRRQIAKEKGFVL